MIKLFLFFLVISGLTTGAAYAKAIQTLLWDKTPITVLLPVEQERLVHFDEPVVIDTLESHLSAEQLRIVNHNGTLYITALTPFSKKRIAVRKKQSTESVLLDVMGVEEGENTALRILFTSQENKKETFVMPEDALSAYVKLFRFGVQALYAPTRLIKKPQGIYRTALETKRTQTLLAHVPVLAKPLISWRAGPYTLTAVLLRNKSEHAVALTSYQLIGQWLAALWYPNQTLAPKGEPEDTTVLFLLADNAFAAKVSP